MAEITGADPSIMSGKVVGAQKPRNWARCIIYRSANVRLIPVRPELSGVLAAADIHFDTGQVYLEARGLRDPATLGQDPASGQPLAYYVGWLINPNTRIYKNLGALQPRVRGGYGLKADCDDPLEYLNLLLVTVQAMEGGARPGPLVVLAGAVCAAMPIAETQEPDEMRAPEKMEKTSGESPEKVLGEAPEKGREAAFPAAGVKVETERPANIAAYQAAPPPPAAYYRETVYVVQAGDTFDEIARRFGARPEVLAARNFITNPHYLFPGQILFVPWPPTSGTKE